MAAGIFETGRNLIDEHGLEETFSVVSMESIREAHLEWTALLPAVRPYYAIKCFPDDEVMRFMGGLGMGFDCASEAEMEAAVAALAGGAGDPGADVILSHPVKRARDLAYAQRAGVRLVVVDSVSELSKLEGSSFDIVLRIRADDPDARVCLGRKFGALPDEYGPILATARRLGLRVRGVSFHVGSGCRNPSIFWEALRRARTAMDAAAGFGFDARLLDIGGGFTRSNFAECADSIRSGLDAHFGGWGIEVIAEPGRYFAERCLTLFVRVLGTRERDEKMEYWISDGLYGYFNCVLYDDQRPEPLPLFDRASHGEPAAAAESVLWGPTCDSADLVRDGVRLPRMRVGDWLAFPDCGAYTAAGACDFNGILSTRTRRFYI